MYYFTIIVHIIQIWKSAVKFMIKKQPKWCQNSDNDKVD